MKMYISILAMMILMGCTSREKEMNDDFIQFNQFLGSEKAEVLDKTVDSFHEFLKSNYQTQQDLSNQTFAFLEELNSFHNRDSAWKWLDSNWIINTDLNEKLLKDWEESGLRQEVWLYGLELREEGRGERAYADTTIYSAHDIRKQAIRDSLLFFNLEGDWINGLQKYAVNDPYMKEFVDVQLMMPLSSGVLIPSFIENDIDLTNPFIQRVIVTELFIPIIDKDLEKKNRKTTRQHWLKSKRSTRENED